MGFSIFGLNKDTPPAAKAVGNIFLLAALAVSGPWAHLVVVLPHGTDIVFWAGWAGKLLSLFYVNKNA